MDKEIDFDLEVQSTINSIQELLLVKSKEYRRNNNPYHNFEVAAKMNNCTREQALHGFLLKHLVSISDIRNDIVLGKLPSIEAVHEKYNDIILYNIIEKTMILDRIERQKTE